MTAARLLWRAGWVACAAGAAAACYAQSGWKPEKNVEIIVGTTPGGGQDRTARVIQRIVQEKNLVDVPIAVVNRPGGGGAVALAYSHQRKGDGHFLQIASPTMITNHLTGKSLYNWPDFSPIAIMFTEAIVFAVKADSPIHRCAAAPISSRSSGKIRRQCRSRPPPARATSITSHRFSSDARPACPRAS